MRTAILVLMGSLSACVPIVAAELTYCAFEVKVTTASGTPRSNVPVILVREHKSTFAEVTTDPNGLARLCDAPLEAVDIAMGFDVCGLVIVRDLHPPVA